MPQGVWPTSINTAPVVGDEPAAAPRTSTPCQPTCGCRTPWMAHASCQPKPGRTRATRYWRWERPGPSTRRSTTWGNRPQCDGNHRRPAQVNGQKVRFHPPLGPSGRDGRAQKSGSETVPSRRFGGRSASGLTHSLPGSPFGAFPGSSCGAWPGSRGGCVGYRLFGVLKGHRSPPYEKTGAVLPGLGRVDGSSDSG